MMQYRAALVFGLTLLFAGAIVIFGDGRTTISPVSGRITSWEEKIREYGGAPAYEILAQDVERSSAEEKHTAAHNFGAALYLVEGENGLFVCDSRFSFGCFHEFLGRAISDLGIESVKRLNEGCVEALGPMALSCQHGIGHGIQAYFGYTEDALRDALPVCRDLPYNDPIGGCYGGLFMEYNLETMLGEDAVVRAPEAGDLQAPCDDLSEAYAQACYFWQPQWWRQTLRSEGVVDAESAYERIGELCDEAGGIFARACFEGVGNNIPVDADFDARVAKRLCEVASDDSTKRLYCKSLAANSLGVGGAGKKGDAEAVCEGLAGDSLAYCIGYAHNTLNIAEPGKFISE